MSRQLGASASSASVMPFSAKMGVSPLALPPGYAMRPSNGRCAGCGERHDGASHADVAKRIALAIVSGQFPADDLPLAFEDLRMHLRAREVQQAAEALTASRAGRSVWAWPATAPWAGFGDARRSP
jgi:hypothetical protein